jgi:hypothetical protein
MSEILSRFSLDSAKMNYQVAACMFILWIVVLICTLSSIKNQGWSRPKRILWLLVVCCLPGVGTLIYLPFSIRWENYPHLKFLRQDAK